MHLEILLRNLLRFHLDPSSRNMLLHDGSCSYKKFKVDDGVEFMHELPAGVFKSSCLGPQFLLNRFHVNISSVQQSHLVFELYHGCEFLEVLILSWLKRLIRTGCPSISQPSKALSLEEISLLSGSSHKVFLLCIMFGTYLSA